MKRFCVGKVGNWGIIEWEEGIYPQMGDKLYSLPSKPLSDEEINMLVVQKLETWNTKQAMIDFARAIEERHGIK